MTTQGHVYSWGDPDDGGKIPENVEKELTNQKVVSIHSTERAFTVLTETGDIYSWGLEFYGGDSSSVKREKFH